MGKETEKQFYNGKSNHSKNILRKHAVLELSKNDWRISIKLFKNGF